MLASGAMHTVRDSVRHDVDRTPSIIRRYPDLLYSPSYAQSAADAQTIHLMCWRATNEGFTVCGLQRLWRCRPQTVNTGPVLRRHGRYMVAHLTPGPHVPVPPVTGSPLNATTQETAKNSQPLTLQQPGHFQGPLLAHGFQLGDKDAYVGYALHGAYSTLSGTLYGDDGSSSTATIVIVDTTARTPRLLFRSDVPQGARKHFVIPVRGVGHLMFEQTKCCGIDVDVIAAMARGPRIPLRPATGTALEAAPIDTSQGSQLLTLDNPGHFTGVLITDGFQLGDNGAYATYLLQHRYTTLAGTLYGDDASSSTGSIALEGRLGATSRLLARFDVPQGAQRTFHISVRGVDRLTVSQTECCGVSVDVVAALQC
jgi:hypothetical protein